MKPFDRELAELHADLRQVVQNISSAMVADSVEDVLYSLNNAAECTEMLLISINALLAKAKDNSDEQSNTN